MSEEIRWAIADAISAGLPKCGECYWWMKSRDCPKEHNVMGMSRGPSCGDSACQKFLAKNDETAAIIAERRKRIDAYINSCQRK